MLYKTRATAKAPSAAPMGRIKISPAAFDVTEEAADVEWDDVAEVIAAVEVSEEPALAVDSSDEAVLALELVSALVAVAEAVPELVVTGIVVWVLPGVAADGAPKPSLVRRAPISEKVPNREP
jgi:hypothetical protein